MKKIAFCMMFLLWAGPMAAEKLLVLPEVIKPYKIVINDNRLYVASENTSVYAYSTGQSNKFIKSFLQKGEGPGEAGAPFVILNVYRDFLTAEEARKKILFYSKDGKYIDETRIPAHMTHILCLGESYKGNNYLAKSKHIDEKKGTEYTSVELLDNTFNIIKRLRKGEEKPIYNSKKQKIIRPQRHVLDYCLSAGKIYLLDTSRGFAVTVFDEQGNRIDHLDIEYRKVKIPQSHVDKFLKRLKKNPMVWARIKDRFEYRFPEYFPAVRRFWVDNGKIYALTNRSRPAGENGKLTRELVTADLQGKVSGSIFVPDIYECNVYKDKFYYLSENQYNEDWEVHTLVLNQRK